MKHKILSITNGDAYNTYFRTTFSREAFPFREVMMDGDAVEEIGSEAFMRARARTHGVSYEKYVKRAAVLTVLKNNLDEYDEVHLYFGKDVFCQMNLLTLLAFLEQLGCQSRVTLFYIDDETFRTLEGMIRVTLGGYSALYKAILVEKKKCAAVGVILPRAIDLYFDYLSENGELAGIVKKHKEETELSLVSILLNASREYGLSDLQAKALIEKYKK